MSEVSRTEVIDFLLVDDDSELVESVSDLLNDFFGFEGHVAYDGMFALDLVRRNHYQFIITDYKMDTINGDILIKAIRGSDSLNKNTDIIILTGYADSLEDNILKLPHVKLLQKPIEPSQLKFEIQNIVKNAN